MKEGHPWMRRTSEMRGARDKWVARRWFAASVGLLWLAYAVRTLTLQAQGLWRDEVDQWRFAFHPIREILSRFTQAGWNGPLFSPLLRGWIALTGESVFAMRAFSVLWAVVSVALMMVLARRLSKSGRIGFLTGLLTACSPYYAWYGQEIKMYTWVPMLVLLALYALDRACAEAKYSWWAVTWLSATLAFYSHILAALLIPVMVLWYILHPARRTRAWIGGLGTLAGLTVPYLPLVAWQARMAFRVRETGFPDHTLSEMMAELATRWSWGITQGVWDSRMTYMWTVVLGTSALALVGMAVWSWRGRWKRAAQLGIWLALPLLGVWVISLRGSIFTERYLLWSAPGFYLAVAVGLDWILERDGSAGVVLLALLLIVQGHGLVVQATEPIKPQFQAAVRYVEARRGPHVDSGSEAGEDDPRDLILFQIPYNRYVYEFYAEGPLDPWAEGPYTNWPAEGGGYLKGEAYVDAVMRDLVGNHDEVWLIYSEVALWDDRELVKAWLEAHYRQIAARRYPGVEVYRYRR